MVQMNKKFDELGVAQVKARLASKVFLGAEASLAAEWLAHQEAKAADEALELARDSNQQSRIAADEARKANRIAGAALVIAVIGAVIAIATAIHGWK